MAVLTETQRLAWKAFYLAHASLMAQIEADLETAGDCTFADYDVLYTLEKAPGRRLRLAELAANVTVSQSGLSRRLDRLEKLGWLARERDSSDRRGIFAVLTGAGQDAIDRTWPIYAESIAKLFASVLTDEECKVLYRMMVRLLANRPEGAPSIHRPD